jgi:hypothetical protein
VALFSCGFDVRYDAPSKNSARAFRPSCRRRERSFLGPPTCICDPRLFPSYFFPRLADFDHRLLTHSLSLPSISYTHAIAHLRARTQALHPTLSLSLSLSLPLRPCLPSNFLFIKYILHKGIIFPLEAEAFVRSGKSFIRTRESI